MMWAAGILASISSITYPAISAFVSLHSEADKQGLVQGMVTGMRGLCNGLGPAMFGVIFYLFHVDLDGTSVNTYHTTNKTLENAENTPKVNEFCCITIFYFFLWVDNYDPSLRAQGRDRLLPFVFSLSESFHYHQIQYFSDSTSVYFRIIIQRIISYFFFPSYLTIYLFNIKLPLVVLKDHLGVIMIDSLTIQNLKEKSNHPQLPLPIPNPFLTCSLKPQIKYVMIFINKCCTLIYCSF